MEVTVYFTAQLRQRLGTPSVALQLSENATSCDAVDTLTRQFPAFREHAIASDGKLLPAVWLSVNERQVPRDEEVFLHAGDRLYLVSAISGG